MKHLILSIVLILTIGGGSILAQSDELKKLENQLDSVFGLERLMKLNQLSEKYEKLNERKAFRYAKKAVDLSENLLFNNDLSAFENKQPFANAYYSLAKFEFEKEQYFDAKEHFSRSIELSKDSSKYQEKSSVYIDSIQGKIDRGEIKESKFLNQINNLKIGKMVKDASLDVSIQSEIKIAEGKESIGNIEGALINYKKAINLLRNKGDFKTINKVQLRVSQLLSDLNRDNEAQDFLEDAITERENEVERVEYNDTSSNSLVQIKNIADSLAEAKDFENSLVYYRLYNEVSKRLIRDSINASNLSDQKQKEILLLKQQKRIADFKVQAAAREKERQDHIQTTIIIIALLFLVASFLILYFYVMKKREHAKLNQTYEHLKQTKNELEKAEEKITSLLKQQVSEDIADQLIVSNIEQPAEKHFVCIMFLDIRNFTARAEKLSPEELIQFQNSVFGFMLDCVEHHHGNINQLLGDGFMATFGAPKSHGNDSQNAFNAAIEIIDELENRIKKQHLPEIRIGIGLHSGYVVTGNVGNKNRKQYSVTGNPVIIASRIEQLTKRYHCQLIISEAVFKQIDSKNDRLSERRLESVMLKGRSDKTDIIIIC